jgi:hypothetical protein
MNDRAIASHIVKAQICSDAGKDKYDPELIMPGHKHAVRVEYREKDYHILHAINGIVRSRNSIFRFSVTDESNIEGMAIVYFQFTIENIRYQVSFHTYLPDKLGAFVTSKRMRMKWDHASSYNSCKKLHEYFNLNERR